MKSPYEMSEQEFKAALSEKTTSDEILNHAKDIYEFMTSLFDECCSDSVMREWAFQWWAKQTNSDYSVIYSKWLDQ